VAAKGLNSKVIPKRPGITKCKPIPVVYSPEIKDTFNVEVVK
jgi:hypothetical protein